MCTFARLLATMVRALVSAISSAFWKEFTKGRGWDSIILVSEAIAYPVFFFFPFDVIEELQSIYLVKSGLFKGLRKYGRNGASGLLMTLCKYGWGVQKNYG